MKELSEDPRPLNSEIVVLSLYFNIVLQIIYCFTIHFSCMQLLSTDNEDLCFTYLWALHFYILQCPTLITLACSKCTCSTFFLISYNICIYIHFTNKHACIKYFLLCCRLQYAVNHKGQIIKLERGGLGFFFWLIFLSMRSVAKILIFLKCHKRIF